MSYSYTPLSTCLLIWLPKDNNLNILRKSYYILYHWYIHTYTVVFAVVNTVWPLWTALFAMTVSSKQHTYLLWVQCIHTHRNCFGFKSKLLTGHNSRVREEPRVITYEFGLLLSSPWTYNVFIFFHLCSTAPVTICTYVCCHQLCSPRWWCSPTLCIHCVLLTMSSNGIHHQLSHMSVDIFAYFGRHSSNSSFCHTWS